MTSELLEAYYRAELLLSAVLELPVRARTKLDDTFDTKALALTTLQANANVQMYRKQCEAIDTEHSRVPMWPAIEPADANAWCTPHSHSPTQVPRFVLYRIIPLIRIAFGRTVYRAIFIREMRDDLWVPPRG